MARNDGSIDNAKRNEKLIDAIKIHKDVLLNRLMIETDAPYLNPIEPKLLYYVLAKLSDIMDVSEVELDKIVLENTQRFFLFLFEKCKIMCSAHRHVIR